MSIRETVSAVWELVAAELQPSTHEEMKTGRGFGTQKERESCQESSGTLMKLIFSAVSRKK